MLHNNHPSDEVPIYGTFEMIQQLISANLSDNTSDRKVIEEIDQEIARLQTPEGREALESIGIDTYDLLARLRETRAHLLHGRRNKKF